MLELFIVQLLLRWMWAIAEKDHDSAMACVESLRDWCLKVLLALGPWPCLDNIGTLYVCTAQALAVKEKKLPFPQTLDDLALDNLVAASVDQIKATPLQRSLWSIRYAPDFSAIKNTRVRSSILGLQSYYLDQEVGEWGRTALFLDECLFWCDSLVAILDAQCPPGQGPHNEAAEACVQ